MRFVLRTARLKPRTALQARANLTLKSGSTSRGRSGAVFRFGARVLVWNSRFWANRSGMATNALRGQLQAHSSLRNPIKTSGFLT